MESIYLVSVKGLFAVYASDKIAFVLEHSVRATCARQSAFARRARRSESLCGWLGLVGMASALLEIARSGSR